MTQTSTTESVAPDGEVFVLPKRETYAEEMRRLRGLVEEHRRAGREIVVVMGMGFVGIAMAAIVADAENKAGEPSKFVIGLQRPTLRSYWKIPRLNAGVCPLASEDPELPEMVGRVATEKGTFTATFQEEALSLADVVIVDVQCDITKPDLGNVRNAYVEMTAFKAAIKTIGNYMPEKALVLIETTVPPGTTERIVLPILEKRFAARGIRTAPLVAHSYERVMPGREYIRSIRDFWRVCAGVGEESRRRVVGFLSEVLNVKDYPLTVLDRPLESETAKIYENSWRATCIAFSAEWGDFAERTGVDLTKVLDAVRLRPTHQNVLFSGPGVGGYCLPKDGGFGLWAFENIFGFREDIFQLTPKAIDINDLRGFHVADLCCEALREMGKSVDGSRVLLLGVAYRQDVGDTRYSASELVARKLADLGVDVSAHDPYVEVWPEMRLQEEDYAHSLARYFRRQELLRDLEVQKDLDAALAGMDAVLLLVRHEPYLKLDPARVVRSAGGPLAIVDAFGILSDEAIEEFLRAGCAVRCVARGHVRRIRRRLAGMNPEDPPRDIAS